jgi:hypothetical protein
MVVGRRHGRAAGRAVGWHKHGLFDAEAVHDRDAFREHHGRRPRVGGAGAFVRTEMVVQVEDAELLIAVGVGDHSASPQWALTVISPLLLIHLLLVTHDTS